ncbi:Monocarboxylate transporter 14 [Echinococcus multilocularis]|uniref:Monocarboxylate transporter 14 n=1 Tax=Echinococcus multilocularis TaxID=6211 RepID=A0A068XXP3_ECHMU|nr:Monocarboxylate transporter 14 [Echinococcus multilocularis]
MDVRIRQAFCSPNLRTYFTQAQQPPHYCQHWSTPSRSLCHPSYAHSQLLWGIQQQLRGGHSSYVLASLVITSLAQEIILTYFAYGALLSLGLQLTYTAAFMAVISTFKDSKWLGLACGVMVCGGGIGAFATNHLLSWILSFWTWREALILQGGIFLHAWISASLFYWLDERVTIQSEWEKYESHLEMQEVDGATVRKSLGDTSELSPTTIQPVAPVYRRVVVDRLKSLWYLCPIFMILTPTRHRPRAQRRDYMKTRPTEAPGVQAREFCRQLHNSLSCLFSPAVWTNAPFLIYVLTNGLAAAGVVIPWTFVYDYVRTQWLTGLESTSCLGTLAQTQLAWYPSLVGLGSCAGKTFLGSTFSLIDEFPNRVYKCF